MGIAYTVLHDKCEVSLFLQIKLILFSHYKREYIHSFLLEIKIKEKEKEQRREEKAKMLMTQPSKYRFLF